jgi:hypothetical protein
MKSFQYNHPPYLAMEHLFVEEQSILFYFSGMLGLVRYVDVDMNISPFDHG